MNPNPGQYDPWYGTVSLTRYLPRWQHTANDLFQRVRAHVGVRAQRVAGSYSVLGVSSAERQAKIVIYEASLGKGRWRPGADGVYVLIRTRGNAASQNQTVACAPKYEERFAYFYLRDISWQNLDEVAAFIVACADR